MILDFNKTRAIDMYREGATMKRVAEMYGCNPETVKRRFVEWGVEIRPSSYFHKNRPKSDAHRLKLRENLNRIRPLAIKAVREGKRRTYKGEDNPKWSGGKVDYWKQRILARDGRKCQDCKYEAHPEIIEAHHIDMNHNNNVLENGVSLCPNCHRIRHFADNTFSSKLRPKRYL